MFIALTTHPIQYQVPLWRELARQLGDRFEVWYLTSFGVHPGYQAEFSREIRWDINLLDGYRHRFLSQNCAAPTAFGSVQVPFNFYHELKTHRVEAIWLQGWQVAAYWQATLLAKAAGVQVWLRGESNDLSPRRGMKAWVNDRLLRLLFANVDEFFAIGTANKRFYLQKGVSREKISWTPYFVDNQFFQKAAGELRPQRAEIRAKWGIAEEAFCILFCGKFISKKRPMDIIQAIHGWRREDGAGLVHLLLVGDGPLKEEIKSSVETIQNGQKTEDGGISHTEHSHVTFAGFLNQTEIARAYIAADVLVLSSDHGETWGLVVNEGMACGLPSVVSNACGCAEDLSGRLASELVYPCGNIEALVVALKWIKSTSISHEKINQLLDEHSVERTARVVVEKFNRHTEKIVVSEHSKTSIC